MADFCYFEAESAAAGAWEENGDGETTTIRSQAGTDTSKWIEVFFLTSATTIPMESRSGAQARSHRTIEPIEFHCRLGDTWPLMQQALARNEEVNGTFHFFRQQQNGETIALATIRVERARLSEVRVVQPNALSAEDSRLPLTVIGKVMPHTIEYSSLVGSKVFLDQWDVRA
ncbi:MAG: type VI secretion system tube protein Hcp [Sandaracinaceae bacterium]